MSKIQSKTENAQKDKYRITNWSAYNKSLVKRGDISVWFDEAILESWFYTGPSQKGGQYVYSDKCIESLLGLKVVFNLAYRQTEGFADSLLRLLNYEPVVPSYSQINRRAKDIKVSLALPKSKGPLHLVFDSTGLKVYGEGEWKVRKHGYSKRRTWRKLHLGVDEKSGLIYAQVLTENDVDDASQLDPMLEQVDSPVEKIGADGAYDKSKCWDTLAWRKIQGNIPPREGAVYWTDEKGRLLNHQRNKILKQIDRWGKKKWKEKSGYHRRSLSETAMFRFKKIFGPDLYSRESTRQGTEAAIKIKALNKMTALGMPISVKVA